MYDTPPSVWKLSELLGWVDNKFLDDSDKSDIENYCSLAGAYDIISMFKDIVPIVHGPISCINSYYSTRIATRFKNQHKPLPISTDMCHNDIIFGAVNKLEKKLKHVDNSCQPKLIVILSSCVSDMIAENIESLLGRNKDKINADLLYIPIGGIGCKGFREGANIALNKLIEYVKSKIGDVVPEKGSVNLFLRRVNSKFSDAEDISEMTRLLKINGIKVNTVVKVDSTYDDLMRLPLAEANITFCYTYSAEVMKRMDELFGQKFSHVGYPIGLKATIDWIESISNLLGVPNRLSQHQIVKEVQSEIEELKEFLSTQLKEKKGYIWHPGEKGLSFVKFISEIGLEPIIIGYTYWCIKTNRETIINLKNQGYDPTLIIRGHTKIWKQNENDYKYAERPILFMPKKFWLGNLPCVDMDFFRDSIMGLHGVQKLIKFIFDLLKEENQRPSSIFNRYYERRFPRANWHGCRKKHKEVV